MLNEVKQTYAREVFNLATSHGCKVVINFTKVDGSDRTLTAVPFDQIPDDKLPKSDGYPTPEGVLRVFADFEQDWRSIKIESINTMKVIL